MQFASIAMMMYSSILTVLYVVQSYRHSAHIPEEIQRHTGAAQLHSAGPVALPYAALVFFILFSLFLLVWYVKHPRYRHRRSMTVAALAVVGMLSLASWGGFIFAVLPTVLTVLLWLCCTFCVWWCCISAVRRFEEKAHFENAVNPEVFFSHEISARQKKGGGV